MRCGSMTHHYQASNKSDLTLGEFKKEYAKLQAERVKAFKEFHEDTVNKNFNDPKITVGIDEKEFDDFLKLAEKY